MTVAVTVQCQCVIEDRVLGLVIARNGTPMIVEGCNECNRTHGQWLPYDGDDTANMPVFNDMSHTVPPCVRCGAWGTEEHHFFPQHIAGREEASLWPTARLCPKCHTYWHQVVEHGDKW